MRLVLVVVLAAACASAPPRPTSVGDEVAGLRAELATADDDQRPELLDRLERAELRRAQEANTVFAYRRFLAEFPNGGEAESARALLEKLVFAEANRANTETAWSAFLDEFARGELAGKAREKLGALVITKALRSNDLAFVRHTLARFPEHALRPELVRHEDDLAFAKAKSGGKDALGRYLVEHPSGVHRADADLMRDRLERDELIAAEDVDEARRRASRPDASPEWKAAVAKLELELAKRSLDVKALEALAARGEPEVQSVAKEAKALVHSLDEAPLSDDVVAAMREANPDAGLPPRDALVHQLGHGDPLAQVGALEELAEVADRRDLPAVEDALDSRYLIVRRAAVEALATFAKALPHAVWHERANRAEVDALTQPFSASSWRRVAALREADGRKADALAAWQEVLHEDADDVVARERVLALSNPTTDRLAYSSAARQLGKSAVAFGQDRCLPAPTDDTPPEERATGAGPGRIFGVSADVTVVRQLCAAIDLGDEASHALSSLRTTAGPGEQQQLGLAITEADRALDALRSRRRELEQDAKEVDASFVSCGSDPARAAIAKARASRVAAIHRLAQLADARTVDFVRALAWTADDAVRTEATDAAKAMAPAAR